MSTAARNRFRFSRFPLTVDEFDFQLFFCFFYQVHHVQNWKTRNSRKRRGGQRHDDVHDGVSIESTSRTCNCIELAKNGRKMSPPGRQVTITAISNWSQ